MSLKVIFYLVFLFLGLGIILSSTSWLGSWFGLELNMMMFILVLVSNKVKSDVVLKYFLIQSFSSLMLFQSSICLSEMDLSLFIVIVLALKLGVAPFHHWYIDVLKSMDWVSFFIISYIQKIPLLILLTYVSCKGESFMILGLLSILFGSLGTIGETSVRMLLGYSTVSHLGWILAVMSLSENLWILYFMIYSVVSLNLVWELASFGIFSMNMVKKKSLEVGFISMVLNFLSLAGFPPLIGFFPKWMVFFVLMSSGMFYLIPFFLLSSVFLLFTYIRLMITSLFLSNMFEHRMVKGVRFFSILVSMNFMFGVICLYYL